MNVSEAECVVRAAAYYKVRRRLRSATCKSKSRLYAAETEVSVDVSNYLEKYVLPGIYTVIIVHLLVQTGAILDLFSSGCFLVFEQQISNQGSFRIPLNVLFFTTFYIINLLPKLVAL